MNTFIVGGAVRDILLGLPPKDIDFLVVGATVEELKAEYPGASEVGKSFPVFLYNGEEYALARTERKIGSGHGGFSVEFTPEITLEQDLLRRDLTINSLAMCPENNLVVGASQGLLDLNNKIIRHNNQVAFMEDPLRVFRVARFASQLGNFTVAEGTLALMRQMIDEIERLPPERIFCELRKALCGDKPTAFFETLKSANCLKFWFPEVYALIGVPAGPDKGKHKGERDCFEHTMNVINRIDSREPWLLFAGLCHDLGKALSPEPPKHHNHDNEGVRLVEALCERLKVPNVYKKAAVLFCEEHIRMHRVQEMRPGKAVRLVSKVNKSMPCGLKSFLTCSVGDGMTGTQADDIMNKGTDVCSVRLPVKYHGRGKACSDILLQLQAEQWVS